VVPESGVRQELARGELDELLLVSPIWWIRATLKLK
jgi:hypothetical protein